jgi:hypothetical protein
MWGCPVHVLEAELQDGKKIPKWDPRARLRMFVGFSPVHSSLVPLILNVQTGKTSPQYHTVFDNKFTTVNSLLSSKTLDTQWSHLFKLDIQFYLDLEYNQDGQL